ncbi:MAG: hypothetical protein ACP5R5_00745 [Armatimonadota bacterium]
MSGLSDGQEVVSNRRYTDVVRQPVDRAKQIDLTIRRLFTLRSLIIALICVGLLAYSVPVLAGPLTGAPAIKFEIEAAAPGEAAPGTWAVGLGFTTFQFKYQQTVGGTTYGDEWSQSGAIISAEYSKPLANDRNVAFGGWIAPLAANDNAEKATVGEIHLRYGINPNWGLEIGQLLFDADQIGKTLLHAVYQRESASEKPVKFQAGLGLLTGTDVDFGGVNIGKFKTGFSAFANISYPFSEAINGYLSLWLLSQKFQWNSAALGVSIPDLTSTTLQFSLGVSHDF